MDQIKIGKFIAERRRKEGLTQLQLAEKLGITDRAVSKWETGRSLPDASVMLELCDILRMNVNELLCGEEISMEHMTEETEKNLMEMIRQREQADKRLLFVEYFVGGLLLAVFLALSAVASLVPMEEWQSILLILVGLVPMLIATPLMLRVEQKAGYYECRSCHHRYVPTYTSVFAAMHMGRTRYMKCPACGTRSWQKKVLNKE